MRLTGSVILYKHTIEDIAPLLNSLVGSDVEMLYIIDQGPVDRGHDIASDIAQWVQREGVALPYLYQRHANNGYGPGHNVAIRLAMQEGAEYHVVLNPDVCFEPHIMADIAAYMDRHADIGQLMPKVLYPNGELQRLCKLLPTPMDLLGRLVLPKFFAEKRARVFEMADSGYNRVMDVPYLSGCFMFFRMSALQKVGLFDERFFMYAEDIDMTRRMHAAFRTVFYPDVAITHLHNQADRRSLRLLWVHIINIIRYFNKWGWWRDSEREKINCRAVEGLKSKV